MLQKVKNYLSDDSAIDGSVEKVIFILAAVTIATLVGYYMYNTVAKQTENSSCDNTDSPFCVDNGD